MRNIPFSWAMGDRICFDFDDAVRAAHRRAIGRGCRQQVQLPSWARPLRFWIIQDIR